VTPRDVNLNVTQPVFSGFRTVAQVRSAEATVKAQRAVLEDAEQKLLFDTSKAYLDVLQAQRVLEINRDQESVLQNELDETRERLHIGELKKTDVSQTQARMEAAAVARMKAEGDLVNQRTTYARLTGQLPGSLTQPVITADFPKDEDRFVTLALDKNPAVIAADYNASSAETNITAAKGSLLPQVSLVGTLTDSREQSSLSPERENSARILARVSLPLYRTGSDYSKARAAQQTASEKRLELDDSVFREAAEKLLGVVSARKTNSASPGISGLLQAS
jgi:outer membrane protein TolC